MLKLNVPYPSLTRKFKTPCGSLFVTVIFADSTPVSVLLQLGKAGGCVKTHLSVLSGHINQSFKDGTIISVLSSMTGSTCPDGSSTEFTDGKSCVDIAARFILDKVLQARGGDDE